MRVAVMLAAGGSRRWGLGNKLLDRAGGVTMLARALAAARRSAAPLLVVVGWQAARVAGEVRRRAPAARVVRARDWREGMGASLRAAARALRPTEREVLLFLGDMGRLDRRVLPALRRRAGEVVRPVWRGVPGHPVLLRGSAVRALAEARGDAGPGRGRPAVLVPAAHGAVQDLDRPGQRRVPRRR